MFQKTDSTEIILSRIDTIYIERIDPIYYEAYIKPPSGCSQIVLGTGCSLQLHPPIITNL
jgi:hypothetical protein